MKLSSPTYHTSALSKFCDEQLPGDFHLLDGDEVLLRYSSQSISYAKATAILRVIESKAPGEELRRSQRDVFPLLASAIRFAVEHGILADGSGVFILEGEPPYSDGALVSQVLPASKSRAVGIDFLGPKRLSEYQVHRFIRCRKVAE